MSMIWAAWKAIKAAGAWVVNHPRLAGAMALLATIGGLLLKLRRTEGKVAQEAARADTAVVEGKAAVLEERQKQTKEDIQKATAAEAEAIRQVDAGLAGDAREVEVRRKIAERWRPKP